MFGLATAQATACAPALGLALMEKIGFGTLFAVAAACAGLSLVLLFLMKLQKDPVFDPSAITARDVPADHYSAAGVPRFIPTLRPGSP